MPDKSFKIQAGTPYRLLNAVRNVVILCAGEGNRLAGACRHKSLIKIKGKPILGHIVQFWKELRAEFVLVVPEDYRTIGAVMDMEDVPYKMVVQEKPDGIANAVLCVEDYVGGGFLVALGDCLLTGAFHPAGNPFPGIGVWKESDPHAVSSNYGVLVKKNKVAAVEEKPARVQNYFCGMGVYFFKGDVFDIIRDMQPQNGKREITSLLSEYLERGIPLKPVYFQGSYFNINTERDLILARAHYGS